MVQGLRKTWVLRPDMVSNSANKYLSSGPSMSLFTSQKINLGVIKVFIIMALRQHLD